MKARYRLFRRRGSVFYCFDNQTRLYTSLHTKDRRAAQQLVHARNEAEAHPALCRQLGKVYLASGDPGIITRTWQHAITAITSTKHGPTRARWERAAKEAAICSLTPALDVLGALLGLNLEDSAIKRRFLLMLPESVIGINGELIEHFVNSGLVLVQGVKVLSGETQAPAQFCCENVQLPGLEARFPVE